MLRFRAGSSGRRLRVINKAEVMLSWFILPFLKRLVLSCVPPWSVLIKMRFLQRDLTCFVSFTYPLGGALSLYTPHKAEQEVLAAQKANPNILRVNRLEYKQRQRYFTLQEAVCFYFNGWKEAVPPLLRKLHTPQKYLYERWALTHVQPPQPQKRIWCFVGLPGAPLGIQTSWGSVCFNPPAPLPSLSSLRKTGTLLRSAA